MTEKQKAIIEKIAEEKIPYGTPGSYPHKVEIGIRRGYFLAGARAFDELDKWISIKDKELPPRIENNEFSVEVLAWVDGELCIEYYNYELRCWSWPGIAHWQPIQSKK